MVGFVGKSEFHAYQINAMNGEVLKHKSSVFSGGFVGEVALVSSDTLVALDTSRSVLVTINFKDDEINIKQTYISNLVEDSGTAVILPSKMIGMFALNVNTRTLFVRVTSGEMEVLDRADHTAVVSDALSFSEDKEAVALVQHGDNKIELTVKLGHDLNNDLVKENIEMDHQRGFVKKVFINNYIRTDRSHGFRALLVMEDHSLLLVQQGKIVWIREDSLASIIDVTTSELPVAKKGVSVAKVEHNLFEWLKVWIF